MPSTTPADFGARPGDVLHVRSRSVYGWAIRRALPRVWGNHDAIITYVRGEWGVAEAIMPRFRVTPWDEYMRRIIAGKTAVVFMRPVSCPEHVSHVVMVNALELAEARVRYDWRAILEIQTRLLFKAAIPIQDEWEWYCTESVQACYHNAGAEWDVWGKGLPTPYTTEKRQQAGKLVLLGVYGEPEYRGHAHG